MDRDTPKHRPVPPVARGRARTMRREPTDAEAKLWRLLRGRRLADWKFRRQVPIAGYIVDFVCFEARLIVEADGGQHSENARDAERDARLLAERFRIVRYWNNEILGNPDGVAEDLARRLSEVVPQDGASF